MNSPLLYAGSLGSGLPVTARKGWNDSASLGREGSVEEDVIARCRSAGWKVAIFAHGWNGAERDNGRSCGVYDAVYSVG